MQLRLARSLALRMAAAEDITALIGVLEREEME